jgi:hypothetical protein
MARMWPVAIKKELDTFCGFMGYSESTREVVKDGLGERGGRAWRFHVAQSADVVEDTPADC